MTSFGRLLLQRNYLLRSGSAGLEHGLTATASYSVMCCNARRNSPLLRRVPDDSSNLIVISRSVNTTDTRHPKPIYQEDEKFLKKVLQERDGCEDLPIGMGNPYEKPKSKCILCELGITPNYKNVKLLYQFVSPFTGNTYEKNITGLCKQKHEQVVSAIKLSTNLGLMSNYTKPVEFLKDPKLCDPERPIKPHKY